MATSSITRNFVISGRDKVEAFATAIEKSSKDCVKSRNISAKQLKDPRDIKALMNKAKEKKING